jgi:hypothetical protein
MTCQTEILRVSTGMCLVAWIPVYPQLSSAVGTVDTDVSGCRVKTQSSVSHSHVSGTSQV